ncbi:DUF6313 family protein [Streptomyces decoyicus]|uniref:DUF6313 family protein n=1 Tax=Streptomyces decoyicus TaxID=249567 RepID=UPI003643A539
MAHLYRARGQLSPLRRWLICWGSWVFAPTGIMLVIAGPIMGWRVAYEVLLGLTSPARVSTPVLPWLLSLAGWLVVPAAIGGVAGYMLTARIEKYRSTPIAGALARLQGRSAPKPPSGSGGDHGLPPDQTARPDGE